MVERFQSNTAEKNKELSFWIGMTMQKENAGFEYQGRGVKRKKSTIIRPLVACLKFLHRDLQIVLKEI